MKYIDEKRIEKLIEEAENNREGKLAPILEKALKLERLTLEESAFLITEKDPNNIKKLLDTASRVKNEIYGRRVVLFAPLYISNLCSNDCVYCAFRKSNKETVRKKLSIAEIKAETEALLKLGHKRILMVAGELGSAADNNVDYFVDAINAIYSVNVGPHKIRRVNINCAPLTIEEFKKLKKAGIGTYQIFQETYHEATYASCHPSGPKQDPDNRVDAVDRAMQAGVDDVGIGVLYGLYDYRFETLALLMHIAELEKKYNVGPHTISVPRIEPAKGVPFTENLKYKVTDENFKKIVASLRLSVPYTGMILSTRETPAMRNELFDLGISQVSAGSSTSPGGYIEGERPADPQFTLSDDRGLDEIIGTLVEQGLIPSFCTGCYRSARTGEAFMNLAKPGTIKGKCSVNAMITLKEYLDDFASEKVKKAGYALIKKNMETFDEKTRVQLSVFLEEVERGVRDQYI